METVRFAISGDAELVDELHKFAVFDSLGIEEAFDKLMSKHKGLSAHE